MKWLQRLWKRTQQAHSQRGSEIRPWFVPEDAEILEKVISEEEEPVLLTFWNIPLEWAWEMIPFKISVQVTVAVKNRAGEEK